MTQLKKILFTTFILILLFSNFVNSQKLYKSDDHQWKPVEDKVYLQEVAEKISTKLPVKDISFFNNKCYLVINKELYTLLDDKIVPEKSSPKNINRILNVGESLWALTDKGIYRLKNSWEKLDDQNYVDVCTHLGDLYAATKDNVYKLDNSKFVNIEPEGGYYSSNMTMLMEDGTQLHADPVRIGPIHRITSYSGTLYILRQGELALFDGKIVNEDFIDWGELPSSNTNDFLSFGSRLFISTDNGLAVLRGAALTSIKGKDGLPYENTTCLTKGFDNDIWIGTTKGAVRMLDNEWHYFGADHWLPGNNVNSIAVSENKIFIATDNGIGIINYEPYTLRKKAAYYERHLNEWGHKRLGFIHTLYKKGDQWIREVSDNDGGHTAPYLAAMCYKYLVTGDKSVRDEAVNTFKAMLWLERITPIDGFIARSIWSATGDLDEKGRHGSGGLPAKWYPTKDGKWYWKGDTSSDEVTAHIYSVSIFHDLVAEGKEKELAREHIERIVSYISENGWKYIDMDGKPTRWGRWDPTYLLRPYGWVDKGVNGLEAQSYAKAAWGVSGKEKYNDAFNELLDFGYQNYTVRQKNTFPPENIAPWDDDLAYWSYYSLLRYTTEPELRSIYLRSLERTWEVKRMEKNAWFNFAYGVMTGNDCESEEAVQRLREWTLDCIEHNYSNSFRDDLFTESGYVSYEGGIKSISPRESSMKRGSRRSYNLDGGAAGRRVMEPTGFIRDYWMGRYYGLIEAPKTDDPELISVSPRYNQKFGAEPYKGDDRPFIFD
ncbi:MAG: hypothetical protein H6610_02840 [Ignavibacteriales bacterium]|nr:hypothetical protein [Ignavibacteriales bacterium]MCB9218382.1 hypothetical protein [Ignavibacteriales bacterium]